MIEYKNVVKEYPNGVLATDHISLKIEQGEFVYVVGPSGAGKSALVEHIIYPLSGRKNLVTLDLSSVTEHQALTPAMLLKRLTLSLPSSRVIPSS